MVVSARQNDGDGAKPVSTVEDVAAKVHETKTSDEHKTDEKTHKSRKSMIKEKGMMLPKKASEAMKSYLLPSPIHPVDGKIIKVDTEKGDVNIMEEKKKSSGCGFWRFFKCLFPYLVGGFVAGVALHLLISTLQQQRYYQTHHVNPSSTSAPLQSATASPLLAASPPAPLESQRQSKEPLEISPDDGGVSSEHAAVPDVEDEEVNVMVKEMENSMEQIVDELEKSKQDVPAVGLQAQSLPMASFFMDMLKGLGIGESSDSHVVSQSLNIADESNAPVSGVRIMMRLPPKIVSFGDDAVQMEAVDDVQTVENAMVDDVKNIVSEMLLGSDSNRSPSRLQSPFGSFFRSSPFEVQSASSAEEQFLERLPGGVGVLSGAAGPVGSQNSGPPSLVMQRIAGALRNLPSPVTSIRIISSSSDRTPMRRNPFEEIVNRMRGGQSFVQRVPINEIHTRRPESESFFRVRPAFRGVGDEEGQVPMSMAALRGPERRPPMLHPAGSPFREELMMDSEPQTHPLLRLLMTSPPRGGRVQVTRPPSPVSFSSVRDFDDDDYNELSPPPEALPLLVHHMPPAPFSNYDDRKEKAYMLEMPQQRRERLRSQAMRNERLPSFDDRPMYEEDDERLPLFYDRPIYEEDEDDELRAGDLRSPLSMMSGAERHRHLGPASFRLDEDLQEKGRQILPDVRMRFGRFQREHRPPPSFNVVFNNGPSRPHQHHQRRPQQSQRPEILRGGNFHRNVEPSHPLTMAVDSHTSEAHAPTTYPSAPPSPAQSNGHHGHQMDMHGDTRSFQSQQFQGSPPPQSLESAARGYVWPAPTVVRQEVQHEEEKELMMPPPSFGRQQELRSGPQSKHIFMVPHPAAGLQHRPRHEASDRHPLEHHGEQDFAEVLVGHPQQSRGNVEFGPPPPPEAWHPAPVNQLLHFQRQHHDHQQDHQEVEHRSEWQLPQQQRQEQTHPHGEAEEDSVHTDTRGPMSLPLMAPISTQLETGKLEPQQRTTPLFLPFFKSIIPRTFLPRHHRLEQDEELNEAAEGDRGGVISVIRFPEDGDQQDRDDPPRAALDLPAIRGFSGGLLPPMMAVIPSSSFDRHSPEEQEEHEAADDAMSFWDDSNHVHGDWFQPGDEVHRAASYLPTEVDVSRAVQESPEDVPSSAGAYFQPEVTSSSSSDPADEDEVSAAPPRQTEASRYLPAAEIIHPILEMRDGQVEPELETVENRRPLIVPADVEVFDPSLVAAHPVAAELDVSRPVVFSRTSEDTSDPELEKQVVHAEDDRQMNMPQEGKQVRKVPAPSSLVDVDTELEAVE